MTKKSNVFYKKSLILILEQKLDDGQISDFLLNIKATFLLKISCFFLSKFRVHLPVSQGWSRMTGKAAEPLLS